MDDQTQRLRIAYDALIKARKDIREEVKEKYRQEFKDKVAREVEERTRLIDYEFAVQLAAAKDAGMKRSDVAQAIRTNAHNRLQYFLNLAGSEGFQKGRPKDSSLDKLRQQKQYEILNVRTGAVKFYALGKHVFDTPVTGSFKWTGGTNYFLAPYEGSDVTEWALALKMIRESGNDAYKSSVLHGTLRDLREELEARGWGKVETLSDDTGMGDFLGWSPEEVTGE